jgi:hypothetical protein
MILKNDEKGPGDVLKVPGDPSDDVADDAGYGIYTFITTTEKPHETVEFGIRHQERNAVRSESSRETQAAPAARISRDSALRAPCTPTHKRKPDGQAQCTHEDAPGAIRTRSRVEPHAWRLHSRR